MRSKASVPRLASTRDVAGRLANPPCPQWMKTLEAKYQKLHTKIMQSTSVSSVRQLTAPSKTKRSEATLSRLSNGTHTYTLRGSLSLSRAGVVDQDSLYAASGLPRPESYQRCAEGGGAGARGDADVRARSEDDDERDRAKEGTEGMTDGAAKPGCVPVVELEWEGSIGVTEASTERRSRVRRGVVEVEDVVEHQVGGGGVPSKMEYLVTTLPVLRNVKTSVSRISNKTSKSCPAVIERTGDFPQPTRTRLTSRERPHNTSKRKNMRLFAKMSLEAQHAISETLLEMGGDGAGARTSVGDVEAGVTLGGSQDVPGEEVCSDHPRDCSTIGSGSCASSSGASNLSDPRDRRALRGDNCMFPDISAGSKTLTKNTSVDRLDCTEQMRIPGVGRYDIRRPVRERTFQITFGDFDIRYREIISLERGDSETPPADIREKSIAKCHEWLAKYTPR